MVERLFAELEDLTRLIAEAEKPEQPTAPPTPVVQISPAADLETAARRVKEQITAVQEIVATADKAAPLKRFVGMAAGAVQALASSLDGIEEELRKNGVAIGKDPSAAVQVIADLRKLIEPLQNAVSDLNTISKG